MTIIQGMERLAARQADRGNYRIAFFVFRNFAGRYDKAADCADALAKKSPNAAISRYISLANEDDRTVAVNSLLKAAELSRIVVPADAESAVQMRTIMAHTDLPEMFYAALSLISDKDALDFIGYKIRPRVDEAIVERVIARCPKGRKGEYQMLNLAKSDIPEVAELAYERLWKMENPLRCMAEVAVDAQVDSVKGSAERVLREADLHSLWALLEGFGSGIFYNHVERIAMERVKAMSAGSRAEWCLENDHSTDQKLDPVVTHIIHRMAVDMQYQHLFAVILKTQNPLVWKEAIRICCQLEDARESLRRAVFSDNLFTGERERYARDQIIRRDGNPL